MLTNLFEHQSYNGSTPVCEITFAFDLENSQEVTTDPDTAYRS